MYHLQLHSTESSIGQGQKVSLPGSYMVPSAEPDYGGDSLVFFLRANMMQGGLFSTFCGQSEQKLN